jgi:ribonuclease D
MTASPLVRSELISRSDRLDIAVREIMGSAAIALDTESNSRHHYPEQLCLIQIAVDAKIYLIDSILLEELAPLKPVLENNAVQKVIHGADYDIRCLDRHLGFRVRNLYDTSIAARFAGITEFGLAALLKNHLGVEIVKSERLQQSDWGLRPLSARAIEYAAADVQYLIALRDMLDQRIRNLGRAAWVAEECSRLAEVRYTPPDLSTAYLSVKGAHQLDGQSLAVLRSLFLFREGEALRQGRPPFFVIPDYALITLAANPTANLSQVSGLVAVGLQRFGPGLRQALHDGQATPPIPIPRRIFDRLNHEQTARLHRLKAWRLALGAQLSLDPSLLWPAASLERLAKAPGAFNTEILSDSIRHWQRDQFASSLRDSL